MTRRLANVAQEQLDALPNIKAAGIEPCSIARDSNALNPRVTAAPYFDFEYNL